MTESAADVLAQLPDHPLRQGIARSPLFAHGPPPGLSPGLSEAAAPADPPDAQLTRVRAEIVNLIGASPTEIDVVIRHSQFAASAVMAALSQLELALRVEILPGNRVVLLAR